MKKYIFLLILMIGLFSASASPPIIAMHETDEIVFFEKHESSPVTTIEVPEVTRIFEGETMVYQSSFIGDLIKKNVDVIAIVLLIFSTIFAGLWAMLRGKLKEISDLFLAAYEYTDDKKLSQEERADLKRRFLEIFTRSPT